MEILLETYRCLVLLLNQRDRNFLGRCEVCLTLVISRHTKLLKILFFWSLLVDLNVWLDFFNFFYMTRLVSFETASARIAY
jgi:hypothetical protein